MLIIICIFYFFKLIYSLPPNPKDYPTHITFRCPFAQFDCDPTTLFPTCIPFAAVRNCIPDCPNGADEFCGRGQIYCDQQTQHFQCGQCVPAEDQLEACYDRKWKHVCSEENSVRCASTVNCVYLEWLSDGKDDCGDGSDEDLDPCNSGILKCDIETTNSTEEVANSTEMVPLNTTVFIPNICELGQFRCQSGECIAGSTVLDAKKDCLDGSDENFCELYGAECVAKIKPCSYNPDISTFSCGCPKGFHRNHQGICIKHN